MPAMLVAVQDWAAVELAIPAPDAGTAVLMDATLGAEGPLPSGPADDTAAELAVAMMFCGQQRENWPKMHG